MKEFENEVVAHRAAIRDFLYGDFFVNFYWWLL